ncbi:MAG: hypothetical protein R3E12_13355 [Candidatus Eisenbacteria bacterium]|uniref:Uncharacterized protein n=1 Tax=Eiseniibacteriota bacterium TaxID=2212470 RepID=A0A956LZ93_UNCEI|nr:hypothetical protein [Candidatus Eisenbacteria bacterium]
MNPAPGHLLRDLESIHHAFGGRHAERKLALLRQLQKTRLRSADAVLRLHEALCFLRAYPDGPAVLAQVERMLRTFHRREDLQAHADALQDSGIAGTPIVYSFYAPTAEWLARRWPKQLKVDWSEIEQPQLVEHLLPMLVLEAEIPALDEWAFDLDAWVRELAGPHESDASFLIRRFAALPASAEIRQLLFEDSGITIRLKPGRDTPSRTAAGVPVRRVHWQRADLSGARPDLATAIHHRPLSVRPMSVSKGEQLIDQARIAMATRSRDLDVFAYGDPRDVRLVEWEDGLSFAVIGAVPERRLLLEAVYGFLTLKNGVPIGYVLNSALYGSAEIAYNVFDTYRGGEAAHIYGRVLATVRHLFHVDAFTIFPYQLGGHGNDEGLASGAWWFYQKLGFRARDRAVLSLMRSELRKIRHDPRHRSSPSTLRTLAEENVYYYDGPSREDVIGILPLANAGLAVTREMARRFGSDREAALEACRLEAAARLGIAPSRGRRAGVVGSSPGERRAWDRWAPLVTVLPGLDRWSRAEKRALVEVIRAKGGRRESEFVHRFDRHRKLRAALRRLIARTAD